MENPRRFDVTSLERSFQLKMTDAERMVNSLFSDCIEIQRQLSELAVSSTKTILSKEQQLSEEQEASPTEEIKSNHSSNAVSSSS